MAPSSYSRLQCGLPGHPAHDKSSSLPFVYGSTNPFLQFGDVLNETILYPVPHRHYVFSIPIMLRIYFKHDRALLTKLCRCAYDSLLIFLQNVIGLQDGVPGVVLSIHTFGDYPEKFHTHIHAIVSDGLFLKTGAFYVMPDVDLAPLEEIFSGKSKKN